MKQELINEFAKKLIKAVRDTAVQSNDRELKDNSETPVAQRWREAIKKKELGAIGNAMIPDLVDDTIFYLLEAIDQGNLKIIYQSDSGESVDLTKDGMSELAGWYMGSGGWRALYSKERFFDDLSNLKLDL